MKSSNTIMNDLNLWKALLGQRHSSLNISPNRVYTRRLLFAVERFSSWLVVPMVLALCLLPHHHAAWMVLHERFLELAAFYGKLRAQPGAPKDLQAIETSILNRQVALAPQITASQSSTPTN